MLKTMLQAKLHRVRLTHAVLDYEGSCGIDEDLLDASGMLPNQQIDVYNVSNGERFSTYIIKAPRRSGEISLNGAAARKAVVGDLLIICAYSTYDEVESLGHRPSIVWVDEQNRIRAVDAPERSGGPQPELTPNTPGPGGQSRKQCAAP